MVKGLGRSGSVPRRNSLGDLKIPTHISQAQVGLRRDLGMVREFAMNVERQYYFYFPKLKIYLLAYPNVKFSRRTQRAPANIPDTRNGSTRSHRIVSSFATANRRFSFTSTNNFTWVFSNLKAKTHGRSHTNPTANEVSQAQAQREQRQSPSTKKWHLRFTPSALGTISHGNARSCC